MRKREVGRSLTLALAAWAGAGAGCAHGGRGAAAAPLPDEIAGLCAKLDAPAVVLVSHQRLQSLPDDDVAARQQAGYDLALGYDCLGFHSEALATLNPNAPRTRAVARLGREIDAAIGAVRGAAPADTGHTPSLRLLVSLHRRFPRWQAVEDIVSSCAPTCFDAPALGDVRDELLYLAGRGAYNAGGFGRALDLLGRIPATSPFYTRAKLRQGAVHVRQYDAPEALAAFQEALRATSSGRDPDAGRLRDLANISLARTYYSTGQLERAARSYAAIPATSIYAAQRAFEASWTDYRRADYAAALKGAAALRAAAAVDAELGAEALLLEAAAAGATGDDARAAAAYNGFTATAPRMFDELKAFAAAAPEDPALFARAAGLRAGGSDARPSIAPVLRRMLADARVAGRFEEVEELTHELAAYDRLPADWRSSAPAQVLFADLTLRREVAVAEAGALFRLRIRRTVEALGRQIKRALFGPEEPVEG